MMGFLAATPEGSRHTRADQWATSLPEAGPLFYLWQWVCQMGVIIGGREITFPDIRAWSELTGIELLPHEATSIAELSRIWLNENMRGRDATAFPPWMPED